MTERHRRRLAALRSKLEGHVEMNRAPRQRVITVRGVRGVEPDEAVIDYIDHTVPGDPLAHYEIGLDDFPDEDDDFLADMYLQNLIEDLLAADD